MKILKKSDSICYRIWYQYISLFGSYARGEANEGSDLDFVMDDSELRGLYYVSLVQDLEDEFNYHVDVVSKGSSNKSFLNKIKK